MSSLLEADGLQVRVGDRVLCDGLQLRIEAGESWALLGPNGAGKTSLLLHLAGLRRPARGCVRIGGYEAGALTPRERARRVALLPQHSSVGLGEPVLESVLIGRHPYLARLAWEGPDDLALAHAALARLDLTAVARRGVDTLSGGELRRVEIARLLCQQAPLSLLDEPFNHLDPARQATCLAALRQGCVGPRHAMLMVVHDLNLAYRACPHWLLLGGDGRWHTGPRERLADPTLLRAVYGHEIRRIETADGPLLVPEWDPDGGGCPTQ